jgi:hypothetical protein
MLIIVQTTLVILQLGVAQSETAVAVRLYDPIWAYDISNENI